MEDLLLVEGLAHQHDVVAQGILQLVGLVVGEGGGDHQIDCRVLGPQFHRRAQPVPARRHPHVDEGHGEMVPAREGLPVVLDGLLTLACQRHLEDSVAAAADRGAGTGDQGLERIQLRDRGLQDAPIGFTNRRIVVHHQDPKPLSARHLVVIADGHLQSFPSATGRAPRGWAPARIGSSIVRVAPRLGPSLSRETLPPSSWANNAVAWSPKPVPRCFVE